MRSVARAFLASSAFAALGLPDGLLGVAWPAMRAQFGLPLDALSPLLFSYTAGYVAASFVGGRLHARLGVGPLLVLSCAATGLSLFGYALAGAFAGIVALGLVAGLGAGGIDAGINTYAAVHHGPRMLNWLHACYGVGAAGGPIVLTAMLMAHRPWQDGYRGVGAVQLALAVAFVATLRLWPAPSTNAMTHAIDDGDGTGGASTTLRATLALPAARWSIALFLVYTGLELAIGTFAFTLLTEGRGAGMASAGAAVSTYWLALTAGRVSGALIAGRVTSARLVHGSLVLLTLALALLLLGASPATDLTGLLLAGLAAGPVFPTLIATTPARVGRAHAGNAVGIQVAAAALGQALVPSLLATLGRAAGLQALATGLAAIAVLTVAVHRATLRASARPQIRVRPAAAD